MLRVPKYYGITADTLYELAMEELQFYRRSRLMLRLSKRTGVAVTTLYDMADGKRMPTLRTIEKVIDGMGYDIVLRKRR